MLWNVGGQCGIFGDANPGNEHHEISVQTSLCKNVSTQVAVTVPSSFGCDSLGFF